MPASIQQNVCSEEIEGFSIRPTIKSSYQYKKNITSPRTALEWQLAIANPLSEISRDYFALVINKFVEQRDIIQFQQKLAYITFIRQQRVNDYILRELEYKETQEREKLLKAWAAAQFKHVPLDDSPKGLMQQILDLFSEMSRLALRFSGITMRQTEIDKQWNLFYQIKAQYIVDQLRIKNMLPFKLTEAKQKQLQQALIPLSPRLLLKLHPGLAKKMRELAEEDKYGFNSACLSLSRTNGAMCELAFHSLLTEEDEPLMGAALLAAIKQYRHPFQQGGISFMLDPSQQASMMEQQVTSFNQIEAAKKGLENTERQIKDNTKTLNTKNSTLGVGLKTSHSR